MKRSGAPSVLGARGKENALPMHTHAAVRPLERVGEGAAATIRRAQTGALLHPRSVDGAGVKAKDEPRGVEVRRGAHGERVVWAVLYTKRSAKKSKVYADGVLVLEDDRKLCLMSDDGKLVSTLKLNVPLGGLVPGNAVEMASHLVETQHIIPLDEYDSGRVFLGSTGAAACSSSPFAASDAVSLSRVNTFKRPRLSDKVSPKSTSSAKPPTPICNPQHPDAVLLVAAPIPGQTVDVLVEPFLGKILRPHQKEGVKFLYETVAGLRTKGAYGSMLCDEMGLGKTLQVLATIHTCLRQSSQPGVPLIQRAVVVCPSSLVGNWEAEVSKWIGNERLRCIVVQSVSPKEAERMFIEFGVQRTSRVLITSYDVLRRHVDKIKPEAMKQSLVVFDEGHRLKSGSNVTFDALMKLPCKRRILLTGTPVQNNLEEFWALSDFVVPGVLGSIATFRQVYLNPIVRASEHGASEQEKELAETRRAELRRITDSFVLRRTSAVLSKHLPPKTELYVFCALSETQRNAYNELAAMMRKKCGSKGNSSRKNGTIGDAFRTISQLRKICCHPDLMTEDGDTSTANKEDLCPGQPELLDWTRSGKLTFLKRFLEQWDAHCHSDSKHHEKMVIVSNWVTVLHVIERKLEEMGISCDRLDGATPADARMPMVKAFNQPNGVRVLLISSKAGGVGLNLIGASRIILFDPDWNPATDLQAMSRVWRDGQTKHVRIYRLFASCTIEEKILQRQLFKLQFNVVSEETPNQSAQSDQAGAKMSVAEMKKIFQNIPTDENGPVSETAELVLGQDESESKLLRAVQMEYGRIEAAQKLNKANTSGSDHREPSDNDAGDRDAIAERSDPVLEAVFKLRAVEGCLDMQSVPFVFELAYP
ncbi:DNA repair and recombination protein RAD54B [Porphyridium purpureum]|uniref:DNA repair and recombination protein RAD54B n=1 Tax=Porphyridium purpureum TaxID=35688 RepID=A0A5J4YPY7_PORPP|nr:DNA repair and recombination protein RAD54B [Porphyridium purpureum]|eukprot:POR1246..scf236_6